MRTLFLASSLLLFTACVTDPSPSPGAADPVPSPANNPQITVLDPNLQRGIGFQTATVIPAGEGPMVVQVPVRNLTNFEYLIDFRVLWYDDRGIELQPQMGWKTFSLLPKQLQMLNANSLDNAARNWRMELKWAR